MSDLTERLAAKLATVQEPWGFAWESDSPEGQTYAELVADYAPTILPLLLSEPELVASLPDAVRLSVLTPRERAVMRVGECAIVLDQSNFDTVGEAGMRHNGAIAKYHALAPSPAPLEGTNDD